MKIQHTLLAALGGPCLLMTALCAPGPDRQSWQQRVPNGMPPAPRAGHTTVWTGSEMIVWGGENRQIPAFYGTGGRYNPTTDTWTSTRTDDTSPYARAYGHTAVWTETNWGPAMIVWGGYSNTLGRLNDGGIYYPAGDWWFPTNDPIVYPAAREGHTAVWTGSEMIIWGGRGAYGAEDFGTDHPFTGWRYEPNTRTWRSTGFGYLGGGRIKHTAVWTGTEMLIWGGTVGETGGIPGFSDGWRYNPANGQWAPINFTDSDAPAGRYGHTAVWTGSEMLIWGGMTRHSDNFGNLYYEHFNDCRAYNPTTDQWRVVTAQGAPGAPQSRAFHTAVWTGTAMVVWGGGTYIGTEYAESYYTTGGRLDPVENRWTALTTTGAPPARYNHSAVWTGTELLIWGGRNANYLGDLWAYRLGFQLGPNYVVNTADDHDDGVAGETDCTLREAINAANTRPGTHTITFAPSLDGGVINLAAARGAILIERDVTIDASGLSNGLIISGGGATRIFTVSSGQTVALQGLTLTGGNASSGGAIFNGGGTLTLTRCTLTNSSVNDFGGAIFNLDGGTLALTHCTLSGNSAGYGGALYNRGALALTHCTLSGNSAPYEGGAIVNWVGTLTLTNSIVAGSLAPSPEDILNGPFGNFTRVGANIVQSFTNYGTVNGSGTISNAAPLLAPLGNNGGPMQTMPPLADSPAIDGVPAGSEVAGLITDQRGTGFPRVLDGNGDGSALVDIGAVEVRRIIVTTAADKLDTPTGAETSLREAIRDNADAIGFSPTLNGGTITLDAAKGEIGIGKSMLIDASGLSNGLIISGGGATRIFTVSSGQTVALKGLTLTGGSADSGGAIFNSGGTLTLTRCTLTNSSVNDFGGAIFNLDGGTLALTHCTLSGNSAGYGGTLYNRGALSLTHCTLSGNSAPYEGGAIVNWVGTLTLANSIVAGSLAPSPEDILNGPFGTFTRVGANIVQSFTNYGTVNGSGTISNADPLLAPLGNYGGPTQTMALLPGSPARNAAAVLSPAITGDQRGFPINSTPDIGAYEAGTLTNYNAWIYEALPAAATGLQHATTFDFDGDGVTNGNEWIARTDPGDANSYLRVTELTRTDPYVTVSFPSVVGRSYTFEFSTDLVTWTPVAGAPVPGTGGVLVVQLGPFPGATQIFIRVRVGP